MATIAAEESMWMMEEEPGYSAHCSCTDGPSGFGGFGSNGFSMKARKSAFIHRDGGRDEGGGEGGMKGGGRERRRKN